MLAVMAGAGLYVFNTAVVGDEPVTVPNIVGLSLTEASDRLSAAGLKLSPPTPMPSERFPEGHLISQRPEAGRVIRSGRPVHTAISRGLTSTMTPSLVGKRLSEAATVLAEAGLDVSAEEARFNHTSPRDTIIGQEPPPGEPLAEGASIKLLISNGPYSGLMLPDLTGLTLAEAKAELERLGVEGVAVQENRADAPYGKVFEQSKPPGTVIQSDMEVIYKIRPEAGARPESLYREVHVTFTIPATSRSHTIQIDGITKDGQTLAIKRLEGILGGSQITMPFYFKEEGTMVVLIDGVRFRSYYYQGDNAPVVTNHSEGGSFSPNA